MSSLGRILENPVFCLRLLFSYILFTGVGCRGRSANGGVKKLFEYEFKNVLDSAYGAYVVNGAYSGISNSTPKQAPKHNAVVAILREGLLGNTADVRQSAREASTAISIIQTFSGALDSIGGKLAEMETLTKKASSGDYSQVQVEGMQKDFKNLAGDINKIVKGTEYNHNKLFTSNGNAISLPIGNGARVDIFAEDFSIDTQGLDLTTRPEVALSKIKGATENLTEYDNYLSRQVSRAEDATAVIESEMENATGVDSSIFSSVLAAKAANSASKQVSEDASRSLRVQAKVEPTKALQLLNDSHQTQ